MAAWPSISTSRSFSASPIAVAMQRFAIFLTIRHWAGRGSGVFGVVRSPRIWR